MLCFVLLALNSISMVLLFVLYNVNANMFSFFSELEGIDRTILMRALKLLENKGKLALFKGTSADDEGVKFSV